MSQRPRILDHLGALGEEVRCRILLACESQELTVTELCQILQLPQSTVSRHVKVLAERGWIARRPEGTRSYYRLDSENLEPRDRQLWLLVRDGLEGAASVAADRGRLAAVLAGRRSRSAEFFASSAEGWDELRRELYGSRFDVLGLLALLDPESRVGDLGCGTGELSALLAPVVREVIAVDSSEAMLAAAERRLRGLPNVRLSPGTLERLPIADDSLDVATLFLVLHHVAEPRKVIREACRALEPGGRLLIVDMVAHDDEALRERLGHVWLGFPPTALEKMLTESGFEAVEIRKLPVDPSAKGPQLFFARGRRASARVHRLPSRAGSLPTDARAVGADAATEPP